MNHKSVLSEMLSSDQKILHLLLDDSKLENTDKFTEYSTAGPNENCSINLNFDDPAFASNIPNGHYDTILLTTILEQIDDPVELISKLKHLSENLIIWEFKYDSAETVDPNWKQPWKTIGLTWNLQQHFDLVNELFLQHATLITCKLPYTVKDNKENQNAIR